jgi:outer membrane protein assembly factor BamA
MALAAALSLSLAAPPSWAQQPIAVPEEQLGAYEGRLVSRVDLVRADFVDGQEVRGSFSPTDERRYRNQLRTLEGQPFRVDVARMDEQNLFRLGEFDRFSVELAEQSDSSVVVRYVLTVQPIIKDVQISGNRTFGNKRITDLVQVERLVGTPVDRQRVAEAAAAIEDLYKQRGYYRAEVTFDEQELLDEGVVYFRVREGSRTRVTDVRFDFGGRGSFTPSQLRSQIKTRVGIPFIDRAPLDDDVLREDVDALTTFYQDRGYLDVEVDYHVRSSPDNSEAIVTFLIEEGRIFTLRSVRIYYPSNRIPDGFTTYSSVDEAMAAAPGALVQSRIMEATGRAPDEYDASDASFVAQVRAIVNLTEEEAPTLDEALRLARERVPLDVGVHVQGVGEVVLFEHGTFSPAQIAGLMSIKTGDVYSTREVENSLASIRDAYGAMGFVVDRRLGEDEALRLQSTRLVDQERPEVDLFLEITEHERYRTGEVRIAGNTVTRIEPILHAADIRPERPLSDSDMRRTRARLENKRIFARGSERITPQEPDPADPTYRDVLIEVEETDTGEFLIGGALGSDLGLSGFMTIRQKNFDLADTPDSWGEFFSNESFLGAGQTFDLTLAPGTVTQNYSISLTEPSLLSTDYSLGTSLFYRSNDFDEFDEERYGTNLQVGRRFGTQWTGRTSFRLESVKLQDIDPSQPVDILEVADRNLIAAVGFELARTTVPEEQRFRPTQGSRTSISVEQFGWGIGDFNFTRLGVDHLTFLTVHEDFFGRRTVLTLRTEVGWEPQGQDEVPVYERFYRGGRNFRGFDFRSVSPVGLDVNGNLTDTPVGGTWMFFLGAEIEQPIIGDLIAVVGFIDTGTVDEDVSFSHYRVSVGTGIRVFLPFLAQAPLAFDFGFPLLKEDTDETRLFTFSIDIEY